MRKRIPEPFTYKRVTVYPLRGWKDYKRAWFANCNGVDMMAQSKAQMRQMISEQLDSDKIMGSH